MAPLPEDSAESARESQKCVAETNVIARKVGKTFDKRRWGEREGGTYFIRFTAELPQ